MRRKILIGTGVVAAGVLATATPAFAQDAAAAEVQVNLDNAYVLLSAVLVILMQAGFALVEAGLTRAKSVANIMMKNLMDFCAGALAFFAVGYAIAFGADGNDFFGLGGWFLGDGATQYGTLTVPVTFIFQVAFAATAATIVSGAMAER
ncbi:MAG: ammonium transporter, partial [Acidimicrobiales bacterium]|nr:ammonium transporter [Acidimicrobiales bacterium]